MCGIFGIVGTGNSGGQPGAVADMGMTLAHRGPDHAGSATLGRASLGCRRLAIVDLEGGAQPLSNETGDILAVCNGEIYNHEEIRRALAARGHAFRTRTDAEVLPHLYEERGLDLVDDLVGMFGFAIWDARRSRLVLARDRMGEKPLYYATVPGAFVFASEPKALFATGVVSAEPNWEALAAYVCGGYVPAPTTAFQRIAKLPPGGRVVLEGESLRMDRYWSVLDHLRQPPLTLDFDTAARRVRGLLEDAVGAMLMGDVPVGVFLSGGIDSTAVASIASRFGGEVATFSLGFELPSFDERPEAEAVARELGTRHRSLTITPDLFLSGARELAALMDEPLADPALVPTFLLARFARAEVKAALVGEGSDELFAGYPTYVAASLAARYRRLPGGLRAMLARLAPALGAPSGNTTIRYLLRRFLESADLPPAARHAEWMGYVGPRLLEQMVVPDGPLVAPPQPELPEARDEIDAILGMDLACYLPECLLTKVDRATMAASLEGRAPFLDHRLVEFACRLPAQFKMRGLATKRVLRHAMRDIVPPAVRRRVKRGLTVPLASWLAGPLRSFVQDTLERLDPHVFQRSAVGGLLAEHVARRRDNRRELWTLVMLQCWHEAWSARTADAPRLVPACRSSEHHPIRSES